MAEDYIQSLKVLRDYLVEDRRNMVASILSDPHTSSETSGEFMGLQHFIDAVERAIAHEGILVRPEIGRTSPPMPKGRPS